MKINLEAISLLQDQIYDNTNKFKKLSFSPELICKVTDSIEPSLEMHCIGFIHYIQKLLSLNSRSNKHYSEMQLVEIKSTDENLLKYISKRRNTFYSIKNHLIANHVIYATCSKNIFLVNPYYMSNIPYKEWKQLIYDIQVNNLREESETISGADVYSN